LAGPSLRPCPDFRGDMCAWRPLEPGAPDRPDPAQRLGVGLRRVGIVGWKRPCVGQDEVGAEDLEKDVPDGQCAHVSGHRSSRAARRGRRHQPGLDRDQIRPRASNAPSQMRHRGGGSSLPWSYASSGSLGAYPTAGRRCACRCRMAFSMRSLLMTAQRARSRCCVSSSVTACLPAGQHRLQEGLDTPVLKPAHPGVIALPADHVLKRYGQVLPPRDRAGRLGPDNDLVAGLSVLRIHLEVTSSSLPGLRSTQKTQFTICWAFTTDRTYLGRGAARRPSDDADCLWPSRVSRPRRSRR
jgi:hypothetical protein